MHRPGHLHPLEDSQCAPFSGGLGSAVCTSAILYVHQQYCMHAEAFFDKILNIGFKNTGIIRRMVIIADCQSKIS